MLDPLFRPRSVAVLGASNDRFSIGNRVVQNLLDYGFRGPVYPINPKEPEVLGLRAYPGILDVPGPVDLACIAVKNTMVPGFVEDCGKKGVRFAIIHAAGFREMGEEGARLEDAVLAAARKHGVRVFGPNCQGVMNSDPEVSVYANFTFTPMRPGRVSILAQSGGAAEMLNLNLCRMGSGFRLYASQGNASDVSTNEILAYMGDDPGTRTIILHVESMQDAPGLVGLCRRIAREKAILGIRAGRTEAAAKAVSSHTGSLMQQDSLTDAVFERAGILRFGSTEEMISAAHAFASQPVPAGRRVGIIANAGGPGIMAIDECVSSGLELAAFREETQSRLRAGLIPESYVGNPVDVAAAANADHFALALRCLDADPGVDAILLAMVTPFFVDCDAIARAIAETSRGMTKPVVAVVMTNENWAGTVGTIKRAGIPVYDYPETGSRVLGAMARLGELRKRISEPDAAVSGDRLRASRVIGQGAGSLVPQPAAFELLGAYGVPAVATVEIRLPAGRAGLPFPAVLKVDSESVVHKSAAGGVVLGIRDEAELERTLGEMSGRFPGAGFVVQEQAAPGVEVIVGLKREPGVGSVVMFGTGGVYVEKLKDVTFRLAPLSEAEAGRMVRGIRSFPLLAGCDLGALERLLLTVAQMAADLPEIVEMDLNPVFVYPQGDGIRVVDARIRRRA